MDVLGERDAKLATFAGIDEAGLGPVLGPLVYGFSAFRAPRRSANLWKSLDGVVTDDCAKDGDRCVVADSKVVFTRDERSKKRLETTALAFLALRGGSKQPPRNGLELAWGAPHEIACDTAVRAEHPWYAPLEDPLPRHHEAAWIELRVERLARACAARSVEMLDAGVRVYPEAELNRSFRTTNNKAESAWHAIAPLLRRLWDRHAAEGLRLWVDRQGGRSYYAEKLGQLFPEATVEILRDGASVSDYAVGERDGPRRARITFAVGAEKRSFCVALGSCFAKYARETCMDALNAYFAGFDPALAPTAGYRPDGWRWLRDATSALERAGIDANRLTRER